MDFETKQEMEELKYQLSRLEEKEKHLMEEVQQVQKEKAELIKQMGEKSDDKYEQDMLELVYKQRKNMK